MAKIIVKQKAEVIKEYFIQPFKPMITIGSETINDLVIDDKKVSMNHLKIEKIGLEYYLTDLNSAFGTFMRGRKVEERVRILQGDEIKIGDHLLIFQYNSGDNGARRPGTGFETMRVPEERKPVVEAVASLESELSRELAQLQSGLDDTDLDDLDDFSLDPIKAPERPVPTEYKVAEQMPAEAVSVAEEESPVTPITDTIGAAGRVPYYLLAIYGPYKGKKFQLNLNVTRIGRDTSLNDIVIRMNEKGEVDPSVSRRHATISYRDGRFFVSDRRSKTRTFVNQLKLSESDEIQLTEGDEIEIVSDQKSTIFRFVREGDWDVSSPRKSGVWWVRFSTPILQVGSAVMIILSIFMIYLALARRNVILQRPDPLSITEKVWLIGDGAESGFYLQEVGGYNVAATPAIDDINGDGILDFVYFNELEKLRICDGSTQELLWGDAIKEPLMSIYPTTLADLNSNQKPDIIVITRQSKMMAIDGTNGAEIWASPILGGTFSGPPVFADVNGDQLMDVVICSETGKIHLGLGSFGEPSWVSHDLGHSTKATPVAADLDHSQRSKVIIGTEDGFVLIFDATTGAVSQAININEELNKAKGSYTEDNQIRAAVAVGDLNNDRVLDLAITTRQGNVLALNGKDWKRFWYDNVIPQGEFTPGLHFAPVIGDLNGNGNRDVVVATPGGLIRAYNGISSQGDRAELLWEFSQDAWESFMAAPALADINKDGKLDVVTCGSKGGVRIFNGQNGALLWQAKQEAELVISAPLIADLEGDGFMDLVYLRSDNSVYHAKTNHLNAKSKIFWGQYGANPQHTFSLNYQKQSGLGYSIMALVFIFIIAAAIYLNIKNYSQQLKLKKGVA